MKMNLIDKLKENKILPIIRNTDVNDVLNTSRALINGGLDILEINVLNPKIYEAIEILSKDAIICAGGIITSVQAQAAIDCGAKIISSPIYQKNLVKISKDRQIPFIAGTSTANEAYDSWKARIPLVKIYPISAMGGVEYIENILRPMPFLNLIPQGSVKLEEVESYIKAGALAVGVGRDLTNGTDYAQITEKTKTILDKLRSNCG